ncbi:hypothetical protein [Thioalkalivibrio thiocyanodenitrificans]|uniref:hypothetical protein n=1 Tax=Thioalkalivibrio thiocyanodenitrificans TaxID=243063 RepID=UPI0004770718|nr:hypothetical protein [Thioalkalivibrio thiocyanodenitrificans]
MFERISIFIIAAMFTMLAVPGLWALTLSATADEHVEGGTTMSSQETSRDTLRAGKSDTGARASASATASASASASSSASASASAKAGASSSADGSGKGGCRAESSSTAEARSGDEHVYDSDRDAAYDESGDCRAEAESSASARAGDRGGE